MNQYLVDTKYAVENLFIVLYQEHKRLDQALESLEMMKRAEQESWEVMQKDRFTIEGVMDLYGFNSAAERFKTDSIDITTNLNTISTSLDIIAGSILQIAKQGISAVHIKLSNCPSGRTIGKEYLKNIIWQGRNQAMHFEEGRYQSPTVTCFKNLEETYGSKFQLNKKNLAFEVIRILEWAMYESYERDMKSLLP